MTTPITVTNQTCDTAVVSVSYLSLAGTVTTSVIPLAKGQTTTLSSVVPTGSTFTVTATECRMDCNKCCIPISATGSFTTLTPNIFIQAPVVSLTGGPSSLQVTNVGMTTPLFCGPCGQQFFTTQSIIPTATLKVKIREKSCECKSSRRSGKCSKH